MDWWDPLIIAAIVVYLFTIRGFGPLGQDPAGQIGGQRRKPVGLDAQRQRAGVFAVQLDQPARPPVAGEDAGGPDQAAGADASDALVVAGGAWLLTETLRLRSQLTRLQAQNQAQQNEMQQHNCWTVNRNTLLNFEAKVGSMNLSKSNCSA